MNLLSYLLHFLWKLLSLLPFRLLYLIADGLYLVVCYVLRYRHRVIWNNLREAFPENYGRLKKDSTAGSATIS